MASVGHVAAEEDEVEAIKQTAYIDMKPSFVLNYGKEPSERVRYLKVDVALRTDTDQAAALVNQHMPLLRNELILLFSKQSDDAMGSSAAKDALRLEALARLNTELEKETKKQPISDLLFNNFIVQR
ncbi:flagellar basal body-associated FliL family protein [Allohahella marinimesophila]|uniref:Flagellar protein FliL n=1 Tax=Allohahella marinimesophila TaxID=1054972 RepID=A0ABP7PAY8_9GAMM